MVADERIITLISKKQALELELKSLAYGAAEIRERGDKKYIYAHRREGGRMVTDFIGEYSDELLNLISTNNLRAKEIKKSLKEIAKDLDSAGYVDSKLPESIRRSIDYAKHNLVVSIYDQAILEGVATTYAETNDIINGGIVSNMTTEDVIKIVNLKHAWEFVLNESVIQFEHDLALLCQINKLVEERFYYNAGKLRDVPVKISGTIWTPAMPIESQIKEGLADIFAKKLSILDCAVELLLFVMRSQIFIDGNKRSAVIFANHYLISKGKGILAIPAEKSEQFKELLIEYYENENAQNIRTFLKDECYMKI